MTKTFTIRAGDRVTFESYNGLKLVNGRAVPEYTPKTGTAVMHGPAGWVLNMGGQHGTPAVAELHRVLSVRKRRRS
jgi:hypothetical protein